MNYKGLIRIIALIIIALAIFSACQSSTQPIIEYQLSVDTNIIAGESYQVNLTALQDGVEINDYIPSGEATYTIIEGEAYASINPTTGLLTVNSQAPAGTLISISYINGQLTALVDVTVKAIPVNSITISSDNSYVYIGRTVQFFGIVAPSNATNLTIIYNIIYGSEYAVIDTDGLLTVNNNAVVDSNITVQGSIGNILSNSINLTVSAISVTDVEIHEVNSNITAPQGGQLTFNATVLPIDASYPDVIYSIKSGEEFGNIDSSSGVLEIYANAPVGSQIIVNGESNSIISGDYTITIVQLQLDPVELTSTRYNIEINGTAELTAEIKPYNVHGIDIAYEVIEGFDYCLIVDNTLSIMAQAPSGATIKIIAWAEDSNGEIQGTRSNEISINIYKIEVISVLLHTSDNTTLVEYDSTVTFSVTINPNNSTEQVPYYNIVSGTNHAIINSSSGVLTVLKNNEDGIVNIVAIVDGITSNIVTVTTAKYYYVISDTSWNVFDHTGSVFLGYRNIKLDIKDMPEDAALTTITVPNTVKRLIIEGAYSYISPVVTKNLFFYFNKAGAIDITLINVGIDIDQFSPSNIFDLPQNSNAIFTIQGDCYLRAGTAINPYYYSVNGVYDPNDEKFDYRKHGMDGNNGAYGGNAISGYNIEFKGSGNLNIIGGNGATGSNGGNGADVAAGSPPGSISGNGGCGGSGGDAGYAIYGYKVKINMSSSGLINATSGNAARGGAGGSKGNTIVGGALGTNGANGINGNLVSAIAAYSSLDIINGYVYQAMGVLSQSEWTVPPYETINQMINRMERIYGVDMHVKSDLYNPYNNPFKANYYPMTQLHDDNSVLFMLRVIDNVLSKYPSNIFREIRINSANQVNIYIVNTIKAGSIAGLASTSNNVWLAYSTPTIRNIFYSDVENFAFHELTHIIMYNASSYFTQSGVTAFNGGYSYISGTSTAGIYNLLLGYNKNNSHFLTSYSRRNYSEDICETFSIIARQSRYWDFLDSGTNIRGKMGYIANAIDNGYETCSFHKREYWERFL